MIACTREDLTRWRDASMKEAEERQERRDRFRDDLRDTAAELAFSGSPQPNVDDLTPEPTQDQGEHVKEAFRAFWRLQAAHDNYDSKFGEAERSEYFRLLFFLFP